MTIDPASLPDYGPGSAPVRTILAGVFDPEIPVLAVEDLGVVRSIAVDGRAVHIRLTPTYSGCPAMDTISADIRRALEAEGYTCTIEMVIHPAWTTDWISEAGRARMKEYGIAPPLSAEADKEALTGERRMVACTRCGSRNTRLLSPFGSTACKALFQCEDCHEPFDYFKCLK